SYHTSAEDLLSIGKETVAKLSELMPCIENLNIDWEKTLIHGGYIFAWGAEDIDKERSGLHNRYDIGVFSDRGYHSIDTGKYGMAGLFALELASRICGENIISNKLVNA